MTADVCVVGSFIMDLTVRARRRPAAGETVVGDSFEMFLGGKGFNQVVAARRAGASSAFVGCLGDDDFGERFRRSLVDEGIDAEHVFVETSTGTGVGLPLVEGDGQNSIVIVPRANLSLSPAHVERSRAAIEGARVLLLQYEVALEATLEAARLASAAGVVVLVNPAPYVEVPDELLRLADIVVPNEVELAAMVGQDAVAVTGAVESLRDAIDASVVATLGGRGIRIAPRDGGPTIGFAGHAVEVVDTVGAGDVFCGYLAAGLAEGRTLVEAAELANAAGALAVMRNGSSQSVPYRPEVEAFLAGRAAPGDDLPVSRQPHHINK